jgi:hypothetical protein
LAGREPRAVVGQLIEASTSFVKQRLRMSRRLQIGYFRRLPRRRRGIPQATRVQLSREMIARKFRAVLFQANSDKPVALDAFVPSLDPDIMFGGNIAFLQFLCRVAEQGTPLRCILNKNGQSNRRWFFQNIRKAFAGSEFLNASQLEQPAISGNRNDIAPLIQLDS